MNRYMYQDMFRNNTNLQNIARKEEYKERIKEDNDLSEEDKCFLLNYIGRLG